MEDVPNPEGKDVTAFAQTVTLKGDERDPKAEQWVNLGDDTDFETHNGEWRYLVRHLGQDYWEGWPAKIGVLGDRVYIRCKTDEGNDYLIESRRKGDRLVGRFWNPLQPENQGRWVGLTVNNRRIDGKWAISDRFDDHCDHVACTKPSLGCTSFNLSPSPC